MTNAPKMSKTNHTAAVKVSDLAHKISVRSNRLF